MRQTSVLILFIGLLACGENRTGPPQFPYQLPMEIRCVPVQAALHCTAILGRQDVTTQAVWSTSDQNVAAISAPAVVTPVARGEIEINAAYGYRATPVLYLVDPRESPTELGWISGDVREDNESNETIAGATVEIVEGDHNRGKSATTDRFGRYSIKYVKVGVPFTARASKAGYEPSARDSRVDPSRAPGGAKVARLSFRLKWKPPG